jgi:hypothetical protein
VEEELFTLPEHPSLQTVKEECHECGTGIYNVDACNVLWEKKGKVKTLGLEQWCVMPLSKIFQSYRGGHLYIFILEHGM